MNVHRMIATAVEYASEALRHVALRLHILITVEAYLVAKGVDEAARRRWASAFGRRAAKYRRGAGDAAARLLSPVANGRESVTYAYSPDKVRHLDAAWVDYASKIEGE